MIFSFADANTPEAAAQNLAGQDGLSVLERRATTVNGYDARRILAEGQTQQGQTVRLLAYFIAYGGNVYQFQGLTTAQRYGTYRGTFEQSMTSFNRLTDSRILNVEPTRIAIRPAGRQASFASFINTGALPDGMTELDLAIINQLDLNEMVPSTRPLKLPN
jgi:predicted Zn-dependent protease